MPHTVGIFIRSKRANQQKNVRACTLSNMLQEHVDTHGSRSTNVNANTNDNNIIGQLMIISWQSLYLDTVS